MTESKLLFNERPLVILPELAKKIGLNEAIALQQLHYWLQKDNCGEFKNGRHWIYNTADQWKSDNFPFWSRATIQRAFDNLEKMGLIKKGNFNKKKYDRTTWYSIEYDGLDSKINSVSRVRPPASPSQNNKTLAQNEQSIAHADAPATATHLEKSMAQDEPCITQIEPTIPVDYTETTPENSITSTKASTSRGAKSAPRLEASFSSGESPSVKGAASQAIGANAKGGGEDILSVPVLIGGELTDSDPPACDCDVEHLKITFGDQVFNFGSLEDLEMAQKMAEMTVINGKSTNYVGAMISGLAKSATQSASH